MLTKQPQRINIEPLIANRNADFNQEFGTGYQKAFNTLLDLRITLGGRKI
jgi:hypothetical protein